MEDLYDVTIVGAGPVGMFAAYYAGFRKLKTKVVDSLDEVGGQITALYPDKAIFDVAGFPEIPGKDLVQNLDRQMRQYEPTVALGQQARDLVQQPDQTWLLRTDREEHRTRTLLISSGVGLFTPRKFDKIEFEEYIGRGLGYVMQNPEQYRGKRVAIVGGGDSAVDWANHLAPMAEKVYVIHRRAAFRAHEASVEKMLSQVDLKAPAQVKEVLGDGKVEEIVLAKGAGEPDERLRVDAVLAFLGFITNAGPLPQWGLALEKNQVIINQQCETNLPGIYAAGDCAYFPGKAKLIAVGFGEAATAVNNLVVYLDPKKSVFPGHSSNLK
jgi:ferredoxin/flavodoxin---NADP+ reductase